MTGEDQVPAWVTYANSVGESVGKAIAEQMDKMATKSDLRLVEMQVEAEREARKALERRLAVAEDERKAKGRRVWGAIYALLLALLTTFGMTAVAIMQHIRF